VIEPDGTERERFPSAPLSGDNGSSVPFDSPSSVHFLGTRLMVANQSYFNADRAHHAILDVEAGEEGLPELIPPGPAAQQPKPKAKRKKKSCKRFKKKRKRRACQRKRKRRG
jgi:hypothetical protein